MLRPLLPRWSRVGMEPGGHGARRVGPGAGRSAQTCVRAGLWLLGSRPGLMAGAGPPTFAGLNFLLQN